MKVESSWAVYFGRLFPSSSVVILWYWVINKERKHSYNGCRFVKTEPPKISLQIHKFAKGVLGVCVCFLAWTIHFDCCDLLISVGNKKPDIGKTRFDLEKLIEVLKKMSLVYNERSVGEKLDKRVFSCKMLEKSILYHLQKDNSWFRNKVIIV